MKKPTLLNLTLFIFRWILFSFICYLIYLETGVMTSSFAFSIYIYFGLNERDTTNLSKNFGDLINVFKDHLSLHRTNSEACKWELTLSKYRSHGLVYASKCGFKYKCDSRFPRELPVFCENCGRIIKVA